MVKKFIAVLVCVSIIITPLIASGCSAKEDTIQPAVAEKVTNVYKTEYLSLPEKYSPGGSVFKAGDRIYAVCNETLSMGEYSSETQTVLYSVDMNGENPESRIIETQLENGYISNSIVTSDGSFVFVENSYNMETMAQTFMMTKIDKDGNIVFSIDPSTMVSSSENTDSVFYSENFYVNSVSSDSSGNIFILSGNGILVLAPDGSKRFEITSDTYIQRMSVSGDKVMVSYYDSSYNTVFAEIDMEAKKIGKQINVPEGGPEGASQYSKNILLGDGYDYYIKDSTGVYGFNEGDTSLTLLMNWINSDIIGNNVYDMTVIDADTFMYLDNVSMAGEYKLPQIAILKRIPDDEVLAKYLIRLVVLENYLPDNLTSNIVKFNRESLTHRVYIDDYSIYNDPNVYEVESQAIKTLSAEIASGKIPDMILGNSSFAILGSLEEKGTFVDLYELMDNDPDISRDDFLKCIRLPFEKDGKLYKLITEFAVSSIIGKTENIGHLKENWNLNTMIEYSKSLPEGTSLFANYTSEDMLLTFTIIGINDFINWETKECKFDQETFINVLEYAKTFPESIDYSTYSTQNRYEDQRNNKTLLEDFYLSSFSDYLRIRYAFGTDDLTILGYPGALGGAIVTPRYSYSISAKSAPEVQEGAWQFLKKIVTDMSRLDSEYGYYYTWASTYEALDKIAENQKKMGYKYFDNGNSEEVRYYTDAEGNEQESVAMSMITLDGMNGGEASVTMRLTDEDITFVKDFLDNTTSKINYDQQIFDIITNESKDFFAGTKTAVEVAKVIQSKISIYVSESK